jgi:hypothetical protein
MILTRHAGIERPVKGLLAAIVWLVAGGAALAQQATNELLAAYVPASALTGYEPAASEPVMPRTGSAVPELPIELSPKRQRWEQFEREFAVETPTNSLVKATLTSAKYRLDRTVFALQTWVEDFEDAVSFNYNVRQFLHRSRTDSLPWPKALQDARLKSDVDIHTGGAFVGIRLVLPLGD